MNHSVCFKGHGRYVPREGWLDRGLREVKHNPRVFFENYGADALGVEPKMAQSIRYWLKCSGMIDESVRTVIRPTDLGGMILSKDPYFEKTFSLWMLHCNIARNRRLATAWQLFFNEFGDGEFTRQEMKCKMVEQFLQVLAQLFVFIFECRKACDKQFAFVPQTAQLLGEILCHFFQIFTKVANIY